MYHINRLGDYEHATDQQLEEDLAAAYQEDNKLRSAPAEEQELDGFEQQIRDCNERIDAILAERKSRRR